MQRKGTASPHPKATIYGRACCLPQFLEHCPRGYTRLTSPALLIAVKVTYHGLVGSSFCSAPSTTTTPESVVSTESLVVKPVSVRSCDDRKPATPQAHGQATAITLYAVQQRGPHLSQSAHSSFVSVVGSSLLCIDVYM